MLWWIGVIGYLLSAAGLVSFTLLYGLRSNWRSTQSGILMFWFMGLLSLIMIFGIVRSFVEFPGEILVRRLIYLPLAALVWSWVVLTWKSQRKETRDGAHTGHT